jgi:tetratricopeptide (TPR) repeat protein
VTVPQAATAVGLLPTADPTRESDGTTIVIPTAARIRQVVSCAQPAVSLPVVCCCSVPAIISGGGSTITTIVIITDLHLTHNRYHHAYPWYGAHVHGLSYGYGYGLDYSYSYGYPRHYYTYDYLPRRSYSYDDSGSIIVEGDYVTVYGDSSGGPAAVGSSGAGSGYALPTDVSIVEPASPEEIAQDDAQQNAMPENVISGLAAFSEGRYDDARGWFLRAILEDNADPYAKLLLGLTHYAKGDYDSASLALRSALILSPRMLADPVDLRMFYLDPEQFDAQLDRFRSSLLTASESKRSEAGLMLSYLYFATGRPNDSLAVLDRLSSAQTDDPLHPALRDAVVRVLSFQAKDAAKATPAE